MGWATAPVVAFHGMQSWWRLGLWSRSDDPREALTPEINLPVTVGYP